MERLRLLCLELRVHQQVNSQRIKEGDGPQAQMDMACKW